MQCTGRMCSCGWEVAEKEPEDRELAWLSSDRAREQLRSANGRCRSVPCPGPSGRVAGAVAAGLLLPSWGSEGPATASSSDMRPVPHLHKDRLLLALRHAVMSPSPPPADGDATGAVARGGMTS